MTSQNEKQTWLDRIPPTYSIERTSVDKFYENFYLKDKPCIVENLFASMANGDALTYDIVKKHISAGQTHVFSYEKNAKLELNVHEYLSCLFENPEGTSRELISVRSTQNA